MADTFESRGIMSVCWDGVPKLRTCRANGADIKPGLFVTQEGETAPDVDLVADGEVPLGIIFERYDVDIDTAYDDNDENVPIARIDENHGLGVYAYFKASPGALANANLLVTETATGMCELWVYNSITVDGSGEPVVGHMAESIAGDNTVVRLHKIRLGA